MKPSGPRHVADLLGSGDLKRLRQAALEQRELTESIRARLPNPAAAHLTSARREPDGRLVLTADSAAWAARIRFIAADAELGPVTVRVAPRGADQSGMPGAS